MARRPQTLIAIFGAILVLAAGLPLLFFALGEDTPSAQVTPPPLAPERQAQTLAVAIDYHDPDEAAEAGNRLGAMGYVVIPNAETRITDISPRVGDTDVLEVRRASYAFVVHPRAPIFDLGREQAVSILGLEDGAAVDGPLVFGAGAPRWLDDLDAPSTRLVRTASSQEVMDRVLDDPTAIGIMPVEDLAPRVRALTVGRFDPYRDAVESNPIGDVRWVIGPDAEEVATALGWPTEPREKPVSVLATGELIPARCVSDQVATIEGGYDAIFEDTRELIGAAGIAMAHWEPAVIEGVPTPCTPTFNLSTRPEAAQAAARAGIDVALAVGNHIGDCWSGCGYQDAVIESVRHLDAAGLVVVGAGEDLEAARTPGIVTVDGVTFAFLGYDDIAYQHYGATEDTAGTAHAGLGGLGEDVRAAAERADHVIVGFSWGVEYVTSPTERQREMARVAIEAGASLVVGNHPHWVQATEWIGDGFVVYGLGNFVFDQDWSVETTQGAILQAGFTRDRLLGVRLRPTAVRQQHQVELLDPAGAEGAAILQRMWDATDALPPR